MHVGLECLIETFPTLYFETLIKENKTVIITGKLHYKIILFCHDIDQFTIFFIKLKDFHLEECWPICLQHNFGSFHSFIQIN